MPDECSCHGTDTRGGRAQPRAPRSHRRQRSAPAERRPRRSGERTLLPALPPDRAKPDLLGTAFPTGSNDTSDYLPLCAWVLMWTHVYLGS